MFLCKNCKSLLYSIVISEQNKLVKLMKVNFKLHFTCQKIWSVEAFEYCSYKVNDVSWL